METLEKLKILGAAAKYDVCASSSCDAGKTNATGIGSLNRNGICHSFLPDGRCVSLFRVLMTNACQKDCFYCPNRAQRDVPRTSFTPEELARLFLEFYKRNYVEGLFLSSGIALSPARTMEDMLKTVEILRLNYAYRGYIHLKVLPGAGYDYLERAAELVDRVSINIEAPNQDRLGKLSKLKDFKADIIGRMSWLNKLQQGRKLPAGQTTQFIVGAAGESDAEILRTTDTLYRRLGLRRAYFSAFQPIPGTPLQGVAPIPLIREHRLYQTDFLLRRYHFKLEELAFNCDNNLSLDVDPKMAVALRNIHLYPIEVNKASYYQLLRIPGIGPLSASRIVNARRAFKLTSLQELKNMGVVVKRAAPFLLVNGRHRDSLEKMLQLKLWSGYDDYSPRFPTSCLHQGNLVVPVP